MMKVNFPHFLLLEKQRQKLLFLKKWSEKVKDPPLLQLANELPKRRPTTHFSKNDPKTLVLARIFSQNEI
jgi:hypothetical protein